MKVITDHKWHDFKFDYEVPEKVLKDLFSHLDEDETDYFFKYHNRWYHISDFMRMEPGTLFYGSNKWDGYLSDTFFSGILIKMDEDCDKYMVGMFYG